MKKTMSEYDLYVYCQRDGITRYAGHEASCKAASNREAFKLLYPKAVDLAKHYDEVRCIIKQGNRITHQFGVV